MFRSQSFIEKLRARPLHQRYLFLWSASAGIFLLILWLWTFQLRGELALLTAPMGRQVASLQPSAPQKPGKGMMEQLGLIGNAVSKGSASLFSFLGSQFQSDDTATDEESALQGAQEGDELDQFLPYQPFPE